MASQVSATGAAYLLHDGQNPGFRIIVTVGTNAQINFLVRRVLTKSLHETEERIFGGSSHIGRGKNRGTRGTHDV